MYNETLCNRSYFSIFWVLLLCIDYLVWNFFEVQFGFFFLMTIMYSVLFVLYITYGLDKKKKERIIHIYILILGISLGILNVIMYYTQKNFILVELCTEAFIVMLIYNVKMLISKKWAHKVEKLTMEASLLLPNTEWTPLQRKDGFEAEYFSFEGRRNPQKPHQIQVRKIWYTGGRKEIKNDDHQLTRFPTRFKRNVKVVSPKRFKSEFSLKNN